MWAWSPVESGEPGRLSLGQAKVWDVWQLALAGARAVKAAVKVAAVAAVMAVAAASTLAFCRAGTADPLHGTGPSTSTARSGRAQVEPLLGPEGIGPVRFGLPEARAVVELRARFGVPASLGVNTGCGPRFAEVEWGDLTAEFRSHHFIGYRYAKGGYPLVTPGSPHPRHSLGTRWPKLSTANGISLGSTLGQLRAAYAVVRFVGVDRWESANGLIFVDDAPRDPEAPSSAIIEIKVGTCGDF